MKKPRQARDLWDWKNPVTSYALEIRNFKKVIEKIKEGRPASLFHS